MYDIILWVGAHAVVIGIMYTAPIRSWLNRLPGT